MICTVDFVADVLPPHWGETVAQTDLSPTARALLALELVQNHPGITAERIAERLTVTARAVRRYVAILREAGIPVASLSGPAGGYRLGRGLRLPPLMFGQAEALGLVMAALDGHHAAAAPDNPVGSALAKIMRSLPANVAAQAETVRKAAAPAPDRGAARPDPETTAVLVQACAEQQRIRVDYQSEAGKAWVFDAEPWAVVVRHSRWYLLCRAIASDAVRTYRVDRVRNVEVLREKFTPPADLDPVQTLEDHLGLGWEYESNVVIDTSIENCVAFVPRVLGRLEAIDAGKTRLVGSTSNPVWYAEQLARIPVSYQILGGAEVREAARELAQRMLAAVTG